jgi:hypothetical protein
MWIGRKGDDSKVLFFISNHLARSGKPNIILHCNHYPSSPLAAATFPSFPTRVHIELVATPSYKAERNPLEKGGGFSAGRFFSITVPGSNAPERFE